MSNDKIINLETYKILDDNKYIIVDSLITNTILALNKLGYITKYSCSGHSFPQNKELFINRDLNLLEEIKKENENDILEIREDSFDYWHEWTHTTIYILFSKAYNFSNLPIGFTLNENCISREISFYQGKKRRKISEIQEEIEKYNKIMYEWAKSLPKIN